MGYITQGNEVNNSITWESKDRLRHMTGFKLLWEGKRGMKEDGLKKVKMYFQFTLW